jgi:phenylacetic acid degradation operon negative regulatory protein
MRSRVEHMASSGPTPSVEPRFRSHDIVSTLFADYWLGNSRPLPSALIVRVMQDFGIEERGTREALRKLVDRGILVSSKTGRTTFYGLTSWGADAQRRALDLAVTFGTDARHWDKRWTLAMFSLPSSTGSERNAVRRQLRERGFGMLHSGAWVAPRASPEDAWEVLGSQAGVSATIVRTDDAVIGERFSRAWDIEAIAERYREFVERFEAREAHPGSELLSEQEALVTRAEVMNAWRLHKHHDPDLPEMKAVKDHRDLARVRFRTLYNKLRAPAAARFRTHLTAVSPELADEIRTFTV